MDDQDPSGGLNLIALLDVMAVLLSLIVMTAAAAALAAKPSQEDLKRCADNSKVAAANRRLQTANVLQRAEIARLRGRRIIIPNELDGRVFFDSNSAVIRKEFIPLLERLQSEIGHQLANYEYNMVQIVGHTDTDAITGGRFEDNWDLGAARAVAVLRYFADGGISLQSLTASTRGEWAPLEPGNSDEAKARNRRIELVLLSQ